ncbi:hypothetical protein [Mycolicibacter heraklionensis]|uniref:hypothetical protein n=1 Tax=Mycolicibacter heraklionensis TaxID=512402 RepID=UPI001041DE08|nr:hypothetical protein [Mycolicibacter heraklionensis]
MDTIDRLVDESLATGPVDDYNTNRYDKCWHCDRDWHGIAITERIERMRWSGRFDEAYRVADDDSPVLCPGSDFIGPVQTRTRPWKISVGSYHCEVVPVTDRQPRRDLNFGITVDFRADWLRRIEMELLSLHDAWAAIPDDPFDTSGWLNVGHISDDSDVVPAQAETVPVRSDVGSPTPRRRERHQLRTRTQQQAQAAQSRRELVERMRAAQPHTTRETTP